MDNTTDIAVFWFRRDLRLEDNRGLSEALNGAYPVLPIFIFDEEITGQLPRNDARITFIHNTLSHLSEDLRKYASSIYCEKGNPLEVWQNICRKFSVRAVCFNEDYEPYARQRDEKIRQFLETRNVAVKTFKDQVIFAKSEVCKQDETPYTVFTPYKKKWLLLWKEQADLKEESFKNKANFLKIQMAMPSLEDLGFEPSSIQVKPYDLSKLSDYAIARDYPAGNQTSRLSPHLRFGIVSIRHIVNQMAENSEFLSELIWREFFMQILWHFPRVENENFKKKYDAIPWRNNELEFEKWQQGQTGYPMVDAGMRELNATGCMHNRVRMIAAGFLCKHLLIDWRWGEAYFAEKLLDFELAANNGNWQWAAGTGCDAAPYFRIFNPTEQLKKFDSKQKYVSHWIPELNTFHYPPPIVDHKQARLRAIETYKKSLQSENP